jgi:hypothetical protein
MNSDEQQNITFDGKTTEVVVRRKVGNKLKTPFSAICPITNVKFKGRGMEADIFDLLDRVSKGAFSVFNDLKFNRSIENNMSRIVKDPDMTQTQKETQSRKLKELREVGLIRKVTGQLTTPDQTRRFKVDTGTFIINPEMIRCMHQDEAEHYWSQCVDERKKK